MTLKTHSFRKTLTIAGAAVIAGFIVLSGAAQSTVPAAAKGDKLTVSGFAAQGAACENQAWPNYDRACMAWINARAERPAPRTITLERRDVENQTSTLIRVPVSQVATQ